MQAAAVRRLLVELEESRPDGAAQIMERLVEALSQLGTRVGAIAHAIAPVQRLPQK